MVREEPTNTCTAGIDTSHSLSYVYVARSQRYVWTTVDTVRIPKYSQQSFCYWWQNIHYHLSMAKYTLPACLKFCIYTTI